MSEGETSTLTEAAVESKVGKAVRGAIEKAQQSNAEYWEIRKTIQERLKWHGKGVYKHHVENMDKVINFLYKSKEPNFWNSVAKFGAKLNARFEGFALRAATVPMDIIYNSITWALRKVLPIPKDLFKRMALRGSEAIVATRGGLAAGIKAEMGIVKGVRQAAETMYTGPDIAATMMKRRVDGIIERIKGPAARLGK